MSSLPHVIRAQFLEVISPTFASGVDHFGRSPCASSSVDRPCSRSETIDADTSHCFRIDRSPGTAANLPFGEPSSVVEHFARRSIKVGQQSHSDPVPILGLIGKLDLVSRRYFEVAAKPSPQLGSDSVRLFGIGGHRDVKAPIVGVGDEIRLGAWLPPAATSTTCCPESPGRTPSDRSTFRAPRSGSLRPPGEPARRMRPGYVPPASEALFRRGNCSRVPNRPDASRVREAFGDLEGRFAGFPFQGPTAGSPPPCRRSRSRPCL